MKHFWLSAASASRELLKTLHSYGLRFTCMRVRKELLKDKAIKDFARASLFSDDELAAQRETHFPQTITFSLAVPLYNTPEPLLREMIESVLAQTYAGWELCLADGSDARHGEVGRICREYAEKDSRVRCRKLEKNLGISGNTNAALEMASGEYIGLLDHDDILHPAALYEVMRTICKENADYIYTDENTFHDTPKDAFNPHFKPCYAPDTLLANNYICHFSVFKRTLLDEVGLFDPTCDGSQDYDMVLRLTEKAERIAHIPEVLYYWRACAGSVAQEVGAKPYAIEAGVRAIEKSLRRRGLEGDVRAVLKSNAIYRIRYALKGTPKVSVLIPNCDHLTDLQRCLNSIFQKTTHPDYELVIVENNSRTEEIFKYYELIQKQHANVRVVTWQGSFNYSAVNNFGAGFCTGDYLLLLNNDTEIITPDWIQEMLMFAQRSDVGAVGAKLLFPDDTIQHAGVILGLNGVASHCFFAKDRNSYGALGRLLYAQDLSAVSAACMMLRREVWEKMNGLDESFAVALNDIDLCMRIRRAGFLVVWTPFAELYHDESKSRGRENTPEKRERFRSEIIRFRQRWEKELEAGDPYYNPNFTLMWSDFSVDPNARPHDARVVSHEKAQWVSP